MSLINVTNLTFGYDSGPENIFENVSFQIDTDWKLGFTGRNGRGKTTFLNLLMGKFEYGGSITSSVSFEYFPYPVNDENMDTIEVVNNITSSYQEWQLIKELNLLEVSTDILYRPFFTLSHGEQTKVLLAALFLKENRLLLIDEPTNHLDINGRRIVSEYLRSKSGFILVSHQDGGPDRDPLGVRRDPRREHHRIGPPGLRDPDGVEPEGLRQPSESRDVVRHLVPVPEMDADAHTPRLEENGVMKARLVGACLGALVAVSCSQGNHATPGPSTGPAFTMQVGAAQECPANIVAPSCVQVVIRNLGDPGGGFCRLVGEDGSQGRPFPVESAGGTPIIDVVGVPASLQGQRLSGSCEPTMRS
jgi:ABC-type transport system involved in cytochrome c biogenesis ATPase subunit